MTSSSSSASRATGDGSRRRRRGLGSNAYIRIIAIGLGFYSVMTLFIGSSFISVQLVVDSPDTSYQTLFLPKTKTSNQDQFTPPPSPQTIHNQTKEEPIVVLHAGPHKTGTTSLQDFIYKSPPTSSHNNKHTSNTTFLQQDQIQIPTYDELPGPYHEYTSFNFAHCMISKYKRGGGDLNQDMCNRIRGVFPKFLEKAYNNSQNVLLVAEDMDRATIDHTRIRFYLKPYKRVRVVAVYRRLRDWLPSYYNQIVKMYTRVYSSGEEEYPSLVDWLHDHYEEFVQVHAVEVAERFKKSGLFESVELLNLHEEGAGLLEKFFCDYVPNANNTCRAIQTGNMTLQSNVGGYHDYDRLVIAASLQNRTRREIRKPVEISRAARKIVKALEDKGIASSYIPKKCLSTDLWERMLQTEQIHERTYFPEWYERQGGDKGLRQSLEEVTGTKFCTLDVEKILQTGMMDPILKNI